MLEESLRLTFFFNDPGKPVTVNETCYRSMLTRSFARIGLYRVGHVAATTQYHLTQCQSNNSLTDKEVSLIIVRCEPVNYPPHSSQFNTAILFSVEL